MAQIVTLTPGPVGMVRYRVFDAAPRREKPTAQVEVMQLPDGLKPRCSSLDVLAEGTGYF